LRTRTGPELKEFSPPRCANSFREIRSSEANWQVKRRSKMLCPNWGMLEWGGNLHPIKNEKIYFHPWTCVFVSNIKWWVSSLKNIKYDYWTYRNYFHL
jgi:hypothetical protein